MSDLPDTSQDYPQASKRAERSTFLFLVVLLAPILSVVLVGGYGFAIWMSQLIFGH
ncbi:periplasmic nitrate reductase, NapE protein [Cognatishimia sp. WU-CL00825]|uniref:periplasmic nitrate reductase, NapE protein n=1 Tax=Cognatishimia sp. WU-CL00825 TaxID=3127658 RepID=UPI00310350B1